MFWVGHMTPQNIILGNCQNLCANQYSNYLSIFYLSKPKQINKDGSFENMPLMCHIIQRCCKLTISVRVIPEICTGITWIYTAVFHISFTKMNCQVALLYKVNTLKVIYFIYLFIWFRKIENRQIIGILVCDSFCDCQLSMFGRVIRLAKVYLYFGQSYNHVKVNLAGGIFWPVTPGTILSFRKQKRNRFGSRRPPPTGNPGSATAKNIRQYF